MKLFDTDKVKKFFAILDTMGRVQCDRYKGYDTSNRIFCEREIFVKRTVGKWLKSKYVILYKESEQTGGEYKQYLNIGNVELRLGWASEISVNVFDYSRPMDIFNFISVSHNDAITMEGEWITDPENHHYKLLKMMTIDIPEKEYVFRAYDFDRFEKGGTKEDIITTMSFFAKTEREAYRKKESFEKSNNRILIGGDIIEVK